MVKQASKVSQAIKVSLEWTVARVQLEPKDYKVILDLLVNKAVRVKPDSKGFKEIKEILASKEFKVIKAILESRASQDWKEFKDKLASREIKV